MKRSRVREELELRATGILPVLPCQFHVTSKIIVDRLRVNLLLDMDGHLRHRQVALILLVFSLPDKLRIDRGPRGLIRPFSTGC
jgi:hypothetical protein